MTTTATLGIAISLLIWYSQHHYGIGTDNGSSAILFGWRFTPTLLAVLYTQMTVILFEDAKRTEPFARLAQAPSEGVSAYGTVLQTPRAWWAIFWISYSDESRLVKPAGALSAPLSSTLWLSSLYLRCPPHFLHLRKL